MPYTYTRGYRIFHVSDDGLLKVPRVKEGYGYYRDIGDVYDTIDDAMAEIESLDLGSCVIFPCSHQMWIRE